MDSKLLGSAVFRNNDNGPTHALLYYLRSLEKKFWLANATNLNPKAQTAFLRPAVLLIANFLRTPKRIEKLIKSYSPETVHFDACKFRMRENQTLNKLNSLLLKVREAPHAMLLIRSARKPKVSTDSKFSLRL